MTVYDIAKICEVAPSTVSKVINNYKGIGKSTKEKVLAAIKEQRFQPNAIARSLARNISNTVGIILSTEEEIGLNHYFFISLLDSFKRELEKHSMDVTLISNNISNKQSYLEHCKTKLIDGVFAFGYLGGDNMKELIQSGLPMVTFDYSDKYVCGVTSDNYNDMYNLTDYILQNNHKNIVYFSGEKSEVTDERIRGYFAALKNRGICGKNMHFYSHYYNIEDTIRLTNKVMALKDNRKTAIIYSDDFNALHAMKHLRGLGLKIPQDISVAGYDGILMSDLMEQCLTTVRQDVVKEGKMLAMILSNKISTKKEDAKDGNFVIIKSSLIKGKTVGMI